MSHRRIVTAIATAAVALSACGGTSAPTTTSTSTTLPVTTTTIGGRVTLEPNDTPFVSQGDRGAYVAALQFYLICTGHEEPSPGALVTIDGSFGPLTADAVAWYQAELRRIPTGDPDEATFQSLARDCADDRSITFPDGEVITDVAGSAGPGDPETFVFDGARGQILSLNVTEGDVTVTILGPDGEEVDATVEEGFTEAELAGAVTYTIRVSATTETSFLMTAAVRSPNVVASDFGPMTLEAGGLGVTSFGDDEVNTVAVISLVLGQAWEDTGWLEDEEGCTGSNRHVTWLIQADDPPGTDHPAYLVVDFTTTGGAPYFSQYAYRSADLATLDPIAGGLATADGISLGSTLAEFADAYSDPDFYDSVRGLARFNDDDMVVGIAISGTAADPDPDASRVWYMSAGADGCTDF
ncbi:MAG TPA: peptidoglycan-binding domain-containing protein [Acidimicrobiia bacterium]|nr:peptidoglycan-binding domain-containing protein [Acidimicrobiia bacterium]